MRVSRFACVAAVFAMVPAIGHADDPKDPAMRTAAARARDHEMIRQLNLREQAAVNARDAGYAQGWRDWRAAQDGGRASASPSAHRQAVSDYARDRAQYEQDMAAWRRAVAACRAGDYSACDR